MVLYKLIIMFYLYIIYSVSKDKYYIGHTNNIQERLSYHNSGFGASTKAGCPWKLVFKRQYEDRSSAMKEENRLKKAKNRKYLKWYIAQG